MAIATNLIKNFKTKIKVVTVTVADKIGEYEDHFEALESSTNVSRFWQNYLSVTRLIMVVMSPISFILFIILNIGINIFLNIPYWVSTLFTTKAPTNDNSTSK